MHTEVHVGEDFCLVRYAMWSPVMGAICERSRWDSENVQERNFVENWVNSTY